MDKSTNSLTTEVETTTHLLLPDGNLQLKAIIDIWYPCLVVLNVLIYIWGFLSNALTIFAALKYPNLRKPSFCLLLSLAVNEICASLHGIIMAFLAYTEKGIQLNKEYKHLCIVSMTLREFYFASSMFMVVAISIERTVSVGWPLKHKRYLSHELMITVIAAVWIFSAVITFPPMFGYNRWRSGIRCRIPRFQHHTYFIALLQTIPVSIILIVLMNAYIFIKTWIQLKRPLAIVHPQQAPGSDQQSAKALKMTIMLLMVVLTYLIGFVPTKIYMLVMTTYFNNKVPPFYFHMIYDVCKLFYVATFGANVLIYARQSVSFRKAFVNILCPRRKKSNSVQPSLPNDTGDTAVTG